VVPRVVQAQAEHHALLGALARRDPDGAEQIVRAHNQAAQAAYTDRLQRDAALQGS
jgi:DNA-binding GntR family transcriptional regulator